MARTPFTKFMTRLSEDPKYSVRLHQKVVDAFRGTGLSKQQIFTFLSLNKKRIADAVKDELKQAGPGPLPFGGGPMRPCNTFTSYIPLKERKRRSRRKRGG